MSELLEIGVVYRITNLDNSNFYIGSTLNLNSRIKRHLRELKQNKHHNFILQGDYNLVDKFNYKLDILDKSVKFKEIEQRYLDKCIDKNKCYNISRHSTCGDLISYHPKRNKIVDKITKGLNKQYKEGRKHITKKGFGNPNWKGGISISKCKCGKKIKGTAKFCKKCYFKQRNTLGKNNPFYGKKHSEETIEKLKKKEPNYYPPNSKKIRIEDKIYNSYKEAERKLDIKAPTIRHRCLSKNEKYKNYKIIE